MELQHFLSALDAVFPKDSALEHDRVGLQLQSGKEIVSSCLVSYEITDEVANEACIGGFDCIIIFHPLIFTPLLSITDNNRIGRVITKLIANGVMVYVIHTNLDTHPEGTNITLASKLGLADLEFLVKVRSTDQFGMGVIGTWREPKSIEQAAEFISTVVCSPVRYTVGKSTNNISKVALVAGSGYDYYSQAVNCGADLFVTADLKYHNFHAAKDLIALIEVGHEEMERHVPSTLQKILKKSIPDVRFEVSSVNTSPIRYCYSC